VSPASKADRGAARASACAIVLALAMIAPSRAAETRPPLDQVGFAPPPGASLPLDAPFTDEEGRTANLGGYLAGRPAILVLGYYGCSNLCSLVLSGLSTSLHVAGLRAGRDVDVIVASIAPFDTPAAALQRKRSVLGGDDARDAGGWRFLTGDERSIARLADALRYRYAPVDAERQYAHATGIVFVSPDGHVGKTLYGIAFAPQALRDDLRAAGLHEVSDASLRSDSTGNGATQWLLCFRFDPQTGRYHFLAMNAVRLAALAALLAIALFIGRFVARERRARRRLGSTAP
jgi:protein SCO1/2